MGPLVFFPGHKASLIFVMDPADWHAVAVALAVSQARWDLSGERGLPSVGIQPPKHRMRPLNSATTPLETLLAAAFGRDRGIEN
ncbi:hypothetical protein CGMCC3_g2052 [Colletotrichum fructicola]|nr:uncharacterized protein CGMCC3_g2052 [Colletotrichum fructicola]KAE9582010.1 hypothetical protein CGMCC3_g2052 [Colletotrichum fructicola]